MKVCLVIYKLHDKESKNPEKYAVTMECSPRIGEQLTSSRFGFCTVENVVHLLSGPEDSIVLVVAREKMSAMELPGWFRNLIKAVGGEGALMFLDAIKRGMKAQEN